MLQKLLTVAALVAATMLAACANGVPMSSNIGYVWAETVSACRAAGQPDDACIKQDLARCKALVDYANPGRDESTYMALTSAITTLVGTAISYDAAGLGIESIEAVSGSIVGSNAGTAIGYNTVLYRSSVEACMFSFGRDPKLTEQYFGLVAYTGEVENFENIARRLRAESDD